MTEPTPSSPAFPDDKTQRTVPSWPQGPYKIQSLRTSGFSEAPRTEPLSPETLRRIQMGKARHEAETPYPFVDPSLTTLHEMDAQESRALPKSEATSPPDPDTP